MNVVVTLSVNSNVPDMAAGGSFNVITGSPALTFFVAVYLDEEHFLQQK